ASPTLLTGLENVDVSAWPGVGNENKLDPTTREWIVISLGSFATDETFLADFFPTSDGGDCSADGTMCTAKSSGANNRGQINVYDITFDPSALAGEIVN